MELLVGIGLDTLSKTQRILKPEWPEFEAYISEKMKLYSKRFKISSLT
jgi:hypothetical protein